jgi:hypothetical protein
MINQPKIIKHSGHIYRLFSPLKYIDGSITEGPFYSRRGVNPKDWAYMPDVAFLLGIVATPSTMHCIQQAANPATPYPK